MSAIDQNISRHNRISYIVSSPINPRMSQGVELSAYLEAAQSLVNLPSIYLFAVRTLSPLFDLYDYLSAHFRDPAWRLIFLWILMHHGILTSATLWPLLILFTSRRPITKTACQLSLENINGFSTGLSCRVE